MNRRHRITKHQSGLKIADRICGIMLIGMIVGGMYSLVSYANQRDAEGVNIYASVPTRPEEVQLEYLDELPPISSPNETDKQA